MIAVDQGEHLFSHGHTGREIDLQPNLTGFDAHECRLQILIKLMGQGAGRQRDQPEEQP